MEGANSPPATGGVPEGRGGQAQIMLIPKRPPRRSAPPLLYRGCCKTDKSKMRIHCDGAVMNGGSQASRSHTVDFRDGIFSHLMPVISCPPIIEGLGGKGGCSSSQIHPNTTFP